MLDTITRGYVIDFSTVRMEPFSNVSHARVVASCGQSHVRTMRTTSLGSVVVLRRKIDANYFGDEIITAHYAVGVIVDRDPRSDDGWSARQSGVIDGAHFPIMNVFVNNTRPYGMSWSGSATVDPEEFAQSILRSLH